MKGKKAPKQQGPPKDSQQAAVDKKIPVIIILGQTGVGKSTVSSYM